MEMGGFGDGMPWENIPVRFPAVSALLGENQESLETLPKAVWSRDRAQLGFSELPAKTETSDSLSGLSCSVTGAVQSALLQPGQGWIPEIPGDVCCSYSARVSPSSPETSLMIITALQILLLIVS